jgi:hypothetical protein
VGPQPQGHDPARHGLDTPCASTAWGGCPRQPQGFLGLRRRFCRAYGLHAAAPHPPFTRHRRPCENSGWARCRRAARWPSSPYLRSTSRTCAACTCRGRCPGLRASRAWRPPAARWTATARAQGRCEGHVGPACAAAAAAVDLASSRGTSMPPRGLQPGVCLARGPQGEHEPLLARRSAPGEVPDGLLPSAGLLKRKAVGSTAVGVYASGLTVTVPLSQRPPPAPKGRQVRPRAAARVPCGACLRARCWAPRALLGGRCASAVCHVSCVMCGVSCVMCRAVCERPGRYWAGGVRFRPRRSEAVSVCWRRCRRWRQRRRCRRPPRPRVAPAPSARRSWA